MKARVLVLLGPPGAGKGTQARAISKEFGIPHVSTGDILREAARKGTSVGLAAKAKMDRGELIPDPVVCKVVEERITQPDCRKGVILDGFPRTLGQAQFLDALLEQKGCGRPVVLNLCLDPELIVRRLTGRRVCPKCGEIYNVYLNPPWRDGICDRDGTPLIQRRDDEEEAIRKRLLAYDQETVPLTDYYRRRSVLREIAGSGEPETVSVKVLSLLEKE